MYKHQTKIDRPAISETMNKSNRPETNYRKRLNKTLDYQLKTKRVM